MKKQNASRCPINIARGGEQREGVSCESASRGIFPIALCALDQPSGMVAWVSFAHIQPLTNPDGMLSQPAFFEIVRSK